MTWKLRISIWLALLFAASMALNLKTGYDLGRKAADKDCLRREASARLNESVWWSKWTNEVLRVEQPNVPVNEVLAVIGEAEQHAKELYLATGADEHSQMHFSSRKQYDWVKDWWVTCDYYYVDQQKTTLRSGLSSETLR